MDVEDVFECGRCQYLGRRRMKVAKDLTGVDLRALPQANSTGWRSGDQVY